MTTQREGNQLPALRSGNFIRYTFDGVGTLSATRLRQQLLKPSEALDLRQRIPEAISRFEKVKRQLIFAVNAGQRRLQRQCNLD